MWNLIKNLLPELITLGIGITVVWLMAAKILNVLKEIGELIAVILAATSDKKITKEEFDLIIKEWKDVPEAIKNLLKK